MVSKKRDVMIFGGRWYGFGESCCGGRGPGWEPELKGLGTSEGGEGRGVRLLILPAPSAPSPPLVQEDFEGPRPALKPLEPFLPFEPNLSEHRLLSYEGKNQDSCLFA